MGYRETFMVLFVVFINVSARRLIVTWLRSPVLTSWGTWGAPQICRDNQWVSGIELKIQSDQLYEPNHTDETALNGIRLICTNLDGSNPDILRPREGPWGRPRGKEYCRDGYASGYQLRSQPDQGSGDDVGAVDMALICTHFDGRTTKAVGGSFQTFGYWTAEQHCPPTTAVCGLNTQVEDRQGRGDDTTLNNVNIACCFL